MSTPLDASSSSNTLLEIKSSSLSLPVVKLYGFDSEALSAQLSEKVKMAPDFFRHTPVIIDVTEAVKSEASVDLALVLPLLRSYEMVPVGLRGGNEQINETAGLMGLAVLANEKQSIQAVRKTVAPVAPEKPVVAIEKPAMTGQSLVVTQPVRSGQRVYAVGGDLIVTAQVSNGAEIMADGHIHVYGSLRGRALAGVRGDLNCRIFCNDLRAELVSIAGQYKISEQLEGWGDEQSVQIYLRDRSLIVEAV